MADGTESVDPFLNKTQKQARYTMPLVNVDQANTTAPSLDMLGN